MIKRGGGTVGRLALCRPAIGKKSPSCTRNAWYDSVCYLWGFCNVKKSTNTSKACFSPAKGAFHFFPKKALFIFFYDWRHIFLDWLNSQ